MTPLRGAVISNTDSDCNESSDDACSRLKLVASRSHVCDYGGCGKAFTTKSSLTTHVPSVHLRERNHVCDYDGCGKAFSSKSSLTTHVATVHLMERNHVCDYDGCGKAFSQKSNLTTHVKTVHLREVLGHLAT